MPLTKTQKDQLETVALTALTGKIDSLKHGFRIQNQNGQVAAIYWSDMHAGNEVEIALAQGRLTERYPLVLVQCWLQRKKEHHSRPCNTHKHGSDWPIIGFDFDEALAFLRECKLLRIGFLPNNVKAELDHRLSARSPEQEREARLKAELEALRPTRQQAVIDLVYRAGISVKPWFVRNDGRNAVAPRSNPAYCYNWAFGGGSEPALACVWHSSLALDIDCGHIEMRSNIRDPAQRLEVIAADVGQPVEHRDRARAQAARARQLDLLLSGAASNEKPLRVIVNEGNMLDESQLGQRSSTVRVRHLDPLAWQVVAYDEISGAFIIRRGGTTEAGMSASVAADPEPERYADQHDLAGADQPERKPVSGTTFSRDAAVRAIVLERAQGHCELCGAPGFRMVDGRLFVETHHVLPLAEGGADRPWNVIALCPSQHREAHYGAQADLLRVQLRHILALMYPSEVIRSTHADSTTLAHP